MFVEKLMYYLKIKKQGENQSNNYRSFEWKMQIIQPWLATWVTPLFFSLILFLKQNNYSNVI